MCMCVGECAWVCVWDCNDDDWFIELLLVTSLETEVAGAFANYFLVRFLMILLHNIAAWH